MALRRMKAYHSKKRPYTRKSRAKSKAYIKTIPPTKIVKFAMGNIAKFSKKKFNYTINLVSKANSQIRDNAIESARQVIHRDLEENVGKNYYFAVSLYPHNVLREHKIAAVAQSDRFFSGMKHAFGSPIGLSARVKPGKEIFTIAVEKSAIPIARRIYKKVKPKLSCKTFIEVKEIQK